MNTRDVYSKRTGQGTWAAYELDELPKVEIGVSESEFQGKFHYKCRTKAPIAETLKHRLRVDYEYERAGVANIFMFCELLAVWREAYARETKTKVDWAILVQIKT